jgi:DNA-3-methyladenine glycosylase
MQILPPSFCARPALELAPELLGMHLRRAEVIARITEVEAYAYPNDSANHCHRGETPRNRPMWGAPGHAYVYLCYGIHHLLNIVSDEPGQGAAVLIRSIEIIEGQDQVKARRGGKVGAAASVGPGRVGAALGLDRNWNDHALFEPGGLELLGGARPSRILRGRRVGIGYAQAADQAALWRFAVAETAWVSEKKSLRPWRNAPGRFS